MTSEFPAWFERCKPNSSEELLLKASLLGGQDALAAWNDWLPEADLDGATDQVFWLLPRLYRNLEKHNIAAPEMGKLKGIYRYTWSKNSLIVAEVAGILSHLQAASIPHMVIGDVSLLAHYADDLGVSPLGIAEIAIPLHAHRAALEVMSKLGWTATAQPPASRLPLLRGLILRNAQDRLLELRWHIVPQSCWPGADEPMWQQSVPCLLNGVATMALCPADQLLQIVAETAWREESNYTWIARALTVLSAAGSAVDWVYFCKQATAHRLTQASHAMLSYLSSVGHYAIPDSVLESLATAVRSRDEYYVYRVPSNRPFARLRNHWLRYSRVVQAKTLPRKLIGFPSYLRVWWGLGSVCVS